MNRVDYDPEYAERDAYGNITVISDDCSVYRGDRCENCHIRMTCWRTWISFPPQADPRI